MKGRSVTSAQKRFHYLLASEVGCIACRKDGRINNYISIHHISGRTKPNAHWLVLPLCAAHHQDMGVVGFIPVHPYKARFEKTYGKQTELLKDSVQILIDSGFDLPEAALEAANMKHEVQYEAN